MMNSKIIVPVNTCTYSITEDNDINYFYANKQFLIFNELLI